MKKLECDVLFLSSEVDEASINIKKKLIENYGFVEKGEFSGAPLYVKDNMTILTINSEHIYFDILEEIAKTNLVIVLSKHTSQSNMPALTAHFTGNWSSNIYGGKPRTLSIAPASKLKIALNTMKKLAEEFLLDWNVSMEVTHHGPTLKNIPIMFVEIGSTFQQWRNPVAAEIVAVSAIAAAESNNIFNTIVGFGGPHYAPRFNHYIFETEFAVGHIAPEYVFNDITENEILLAFERTFEKTKTAAIDWKGLKGSYRSFLINILNRNGLNVIKA
ncbi:MAG: D-aminoacyl-tRNA deacylase [Thermoprotei archaeon]